MILVLLDLIREKKKIDTFIILNNNLIAPGHSEMESNGNTITKILAKYRQEVNPDLLFVSIDLSGKGVTILDGSESHPNNILITGFSDSILRFIAERGNYFFQYFIVIGTVI